jgi:Protein of unknown function (DUF3995)
MLHDGMRTGRVLASWMPTYSPTLVILHLGRRAVMGFGRRATAATLLGIGGLHAVWGRGSTFPFSSREALNDSVVGRDATPSPPMCFAIAGLLTTASALVAGLPSRQSRLRRLGVGVVAGVLGTRGVLGFAGKTELVSPGSASEKFTEMDRRYYSPLCLLLALGTVRSLRG